jgi:hypothetical protein
MEARDHGVLIFPTKKICGLDWIIWAMDAARQYNETREQEAPYEVSLYYANEQFPVL